MKRKQQERGAAALEPAAKQSKSPSLSSSLEALSNSASAVVTCGVPLVLSPRPCRKEHPGFPAASDASGAEICARAVESAELAGEMTERDVIPVPTVPAPNVVQSVQISRMSSVRPVASSRGHYSKTEQIYAFFPGDLTLVIQLPSLEFHSNASLGCSWSSRQSRIPPQEFPSCGP